MQLNYRGNAYQASFPALEAVDTEVIGKYRGVPLKRPTYNANQRSHQGIELTFLGNRYYR